MKLSAWRTAKQIPVIYGIYNLDTDKWYIGSCHDYRDRLHRHYYYLTHNQHHSNKLQRAWNKYGDSKFEVLILKKLSSTDIDSIFSLEEMLITFCDSKNCGYNILDKCHYCPPFKQTAENAQKAAMTHAKPIYAIDRFTGKIIGHYSSLSEAGRFYHESTSNISQVCKKKLRYCKNTVFVYESDFDSTFDYRVLTHHMAGVKKSEEWKSKARASNKRAHKVYKYDLNGVLIETYLSRAEAERQNKFKKEFLRLRLNRPIDGFVFTDEIKDIV